MKKTTHISSPWKWNNRLGWYIVFWTFTTVGFIVMNLSLGYSAKYVIFPKLFFLPFQIIGAHVFINIILERTLFKGKYIALILWGLLFAYGMSLFVYFIHDNYFVPQLKSDFVSKPFRDMIFHWQGLITYYFFWIFFLTWILACIEIVYRQYSKNMIAEQILAEKNKSELQYLKTKVHPQFILSTLRNLEQLTATNSDLSTTVVEKLSETLDYILYKGNQNAILLSEEIKMIEHLAELERIRFQNICSIQIDYDNVKEGIQIIPLVVFSFIESNFRSFSIETLPYRESKIELKSTDSSLKMIIQNSNFASQIQKINVQEIEKQLQLLFQKNYILDQHIENGIQTLSLTIDHE